MTPAWNNFSEYPSLTSNEFTHDQTEARALMKRITQKLESLKPLFTQTLNDDQTQQVVSGLQCVSELNEQVSILVMNLHTYVDCEKAIDGANTEAQRCSSQIEDLIADHRAAMQPALLYLSQAPEAIVAKYLDHVHAANERFRLGELRKRQETLLSEKEETLLSRMAINGLNAFSELYDQIAGHLTCKLERGTVGLAETLGQLRDSRESVRKETWLAVQDAWAPQAIPCAAILNGIAGWRLDEAKRRSHKREVHFLDPALRDARIERRTLDAMLEAVRTEGAPLVQRASKTIANCLGKDRLDPWDSISSAPQKEASSQRSFLDAISLIHRSFENVDSTFSDFVDSMVKCRWIDAQVLPNKRHGAFCTHFPKSRTPRVFQSYLGSVSDIRTLAHELGHAHHSWVMRDLPSILQDYPMTLAETASIFAETAFSETLFEQGTPAEKFEISWQNAINAVSMLANIPARFEFENRFYEKRQSGFVPAKELNELTAQAWRKWYGDAISFPEEQFWMTKLHFSIASVSFYNFPYTFGYLFSLAIYAKRDELGTEFFDFYRAILRDTGSMTAEDLVQKHLGEDIRETAFWKKSLAIVDRQITQFESIASRTPQPAL